MGLDQYAYAVKPHPENTSFSFYKGSNAHEARSRVLLLSEWRKHPNLQGWMEKLFNDKADKAGYVGNLENGDITITATNADGSPVDEDTLSGLKEVEDKIREEAKRLKEMIFSPQRVFNNQPIRLSISDLDQLETAIKLKELPETTGFFFGDNADDEYYEDDLKFIEQARIAMREGFEVYYDSWW